MSFQGVFETARVDQINKRSLGRIIIKYCGYEGNVVHERQTSLRKLLQATIDYLHREDPSVWENAELNIYDNDGHALTVVSGEGDNSFVVQYAGKTEEVEIVNIKRASFWRRWNLWNLWELSKDMCTIL